MPAKALIGCALLLLGQAAGADGQSLPARQMASVPASLTFPPGQTMVELAMLGTSNRPLVEVSVNGQAPAVFALDTGTAASVWLGPPLPGMAGAAGVTLDLAGLRIAGVRLQALGARQLGDLPFQGILGTEVLSQLVVELDWQQRLVRLHDAQAFEAPPGAVPVAVDVSRGYVIARGSVVVNDTRQEVGLFVDTGAAYALTVREGRVAPPARLIPDSPIAKGVHGTLNGSIGRVQGLELGTARLTDVVTLFVAAGTLIMPPQYEAGIGFEVLRRFVVYLDLGRERMLLAATDAVSAPFEFTTSGLKMLPGLTADGVVEVFGVVPGSPAAEAGIQAGDVIQAVNGRSASELGFEALQEAVAGEPGAEVALDLQRGAATRTVRLRLRNLL